MNKLLEIISSYGHCNESGGECQYDNRDELHFFRRDGCPGTVSMGGLFSDSFRRLGDGSKPKEAVYKRYRMHSLCFLMKTQLKASSSAVWETTDALLYTEEPVSPRFRDLPGSRHPIATLPGHPDFFKAGLEGTNQD